MPTAFSLDQDMNRLSLNVSQPATFCHEPSLVLTVSTFTH